MTFAEEFPSLKDTGHEIHKDGFVVTLYCRHELRNYCLDKQRAQEAILRHFPMGVANGKPEEVLLHLLKELNL